MTLLAAAAGARTARALNPYQSDEAAFAGAEHRRPAVGDVELGEDVLGVGADRVVRDEQLASYLRPGQLAVEQPQHLDLPVAQRLDGGLRDALPRVRGQGSLDRFVDAEHASRLMPAEAIRLEVAQQ